MSEHTSKEMMRFTLECTGCGSTSAHSYDVRAFGLPPHILEEGANFYTLCSDCYGAQAAARNEEEKLERMRRAAPEMYELLKRIPGNREARRLLARLIDCE